MRAKTLIGIRTLLQLSSSHFQADGPITIEFYCKFFRMQQKFRTVLETLNYLPAPQYQKQAHWPDGLQYPRAYIFLPGSE